MSDNDSLKGKNGKVRVMYVRKKEERQQTRSPSSRKSAYARTPWNTAGNSASQHLRCAAPYSLRKISYTSDDTTILDNGDITGKSQINPEKLRYRRAKETHIYGKNACNALFRNRPDVIVRAWFEQSVTLRFRDTLRWMAANHKAYHVVEDDELAKVSGTEHHGGICFLIKKRVFLDANSYLASAATQQQDCVLTLEQVNNPYNLGAILRSCAHFGVSGVMVSDNSALLNSGAAVRTAEGGAEHVRVIQCDNILQNLQRFQSAGYTVITLTDNGDTSLSTVKMPARTVLVIGREGSVYSKPLLLQADIAVSINGTGLVASLNVSVSAGILLAEWYQQNRD
ncbi:MAG: tRNA/rRNA methyltransferase [Sodalis sp. (in: enterobacteria)]